MEKKLIIFSDEEKIYRRLIKSTCDTGSNKGLLIEICCLEDASNWGLYYISKDKVVYFLNKMLNDSTLVEENGFCIVTEFMPRAAERIINSRKSGNHDNC